MLKTLLLALCAIAFVASDAQGAAPTSPGKVLQVRFTDVTGTVTGTGAINSIQADVLTSKENDSETFTRKFETNGAYNSFWMDIGGKWTDSGYDPLIFEKEEANDEVKLWLYDSMGAGASEKTVFKVKGLSTTPTAFTLKEPTATGTVAVTGELRALDSAPPVFSGLVSIEFSVTGGPTDGADNPNAIDVSLRSLAGVYSQNRRFDYQPVKTTSVVGSWIGEPGKAEWLPAAVVPNTFLNIRTYNSATLKGDDLGKVYGSKGIDLDAAFAQPGKPQQFGFEFGITGHKITGAITVTDEKEISLTGSMSVSPGPTGEEPKKTGDAANGLAPTVYVVAAACAAAILAAVRV